MAQAATRGQTFRKVIGAAVATTGAGGLAYYYQADQGTRRAMKAYQTFVPVVMHYRFVEAKHKLLGKDDKEWDALDELHASRTVEKLGELQGMYCKYGQTAAGFNNTFGEAWIREFRKLENAVPPRPVEIVYKTIEEETGKPVDETFEYFDPIPVGSASIGQVHKAILKGTKEEVAVKVQYPEAQQLFHGDIRTIRTFCEAFAPENVIIMNAMEEQHKVELDYRQEAENLKEIRRNMQKHGFSPSQVVVPRPISELSTKRMLVMELLPGPKLIDGIQEYYSEWAKKNGTTLQELETKARAKIEKDGIPAKYDGPSAWQMTLYSKYLKTRDFLVNTGIATYNGTVGRLKQPLTYQQSSIPPNTPRIVDTLMRVHGYQLLHDGVFNSDPHGGNFILLPDGRLGFIDYGATKRMTKQERMSTCLLYAAIYRKDKERLFQLCEIGGYKSKHGDRDVIMKLIEFGYNSWGNDVTGGKNIQQFIDEMKEKDPWEEVPDNFVMAQFMSTRLRSLALGMNHPIRCAEWFGPIALEALEKEGLPYDDWTYELMVENKPVFNMQKYKFG